MVSNGRNDGSVTRQYINGVKWSLVASVVVGDGGYKGKSIKLLQSKETLQCQRTSCKLNDDLISTIIQCMNNVEWS